MKKLLHSNDSKSKKKGQDVDHPPAAMTSTEVVPFSTTSVTPSTTAVHEETINNIFINLPPFISPSASSNLQNIAAGRYRPSPDSPEINDKLRRFWRSPKVLYREDVEPICHAVRNWKSLAKKLGLGEERIGAWEKHASVIGAGSATVTKWVLLGWIQKYDQSATLGQLIWKLKELEEWGAIAFLETREPHPS